MKEVTQHQSEESPGTILPKAKTDRPTLSAGDKVYVVETEQGILLTPFDREFVRVLKAEERISTLYQNALGELAK